jgi:hypothetical protein
LARARATLVVNGATVAGSVRTSTGRYRIRSVDDGSFEITEVDESKLPEQCAATDVRERVSGRVRTSRRRWQR